MYEALLSVLAGLAIGLAIAYLFFRMRIRDLRREYEAKLELWKKEEGERIKKEALDKSRAVIKGYLAEQLAPLIKEFKYDPSDARFIGDPIDYVIFDGYTKIKEEKDESAPLRIVLLEVKSGSSRLSREQEIIKKKVESGAVKLEFRELKVDIGGKKLTDYVLGKLGEGDSNTKSAG